METADYSAALQALSIITDTATSYKKMEFASEEAERDYLRKSETLDKQMVFQESQTMLANSLALERDAYNTLQGGMKELRDLGVTYNGLDSTGAQEIFKKISDPKVREITDVKANFDLLNQQNRTIANKIAVAKKAELAYQKEIAQKTLDESAAGIAASNQKISSLKLSDKRAGDKIDKENNVRLNEYLKAGRYPLTGNVLETTESQLEAIENSPSGYDGLRISNEWGSYTSQELSGIAENEVIDYVNEVKGEADYSDVDAWKIAAKREAKEYAEEHIGYKWLGLSDDDFDSAGSDNPTSAYKQFEENYVSSVMQGIKSNPNYKLKDQDVILSSNLSKKVAVRQAFPDEFLSLSKASQGLKSYIGSVDADGDIQYRMPDKSIKKLATRMKISEDQLKGLLSQIMILPDDPMLAMNLMESDEIKTILNNITGGKRYLRYLNDLTSKVGSASSQTKKEYIMNKGDSVGDLW